MSVNRESHSEDTSLVGRSAMYNRERNIRMIVAYDGTELHGFQRQANAMTVQEALEEALTRVCNEPITVYGSSRTDAGVHARCQVVTFFTTGRIPVENLTRALIAFLPPYIVVLAADEMPNDWKVRHHTYGKRYQYTIRNAKVADPLRLRYHWHVQKPLDCDRMRRAAAHLIGTHNFTTLAGNNTTPQDPVKTLYAVAVHERGEEIEIHVAGDGFLYHMVRNIAGLLVDVGLGRLEPDAVPALLEAQDRNQIGKTAPPQGLCLEVVYMTEAERDADVVAFV